MLKPEADARIKRVAEVSTASRAAWLTFLGYVAFSTVTILSVTDADFFIQSRRTQLPLVGIDIKTRDFFIFGPAVGAALFLYMQFYLLKLWSALAAIPSEVSSSTLSKSVPPWLVSDLGLALRKKSDTSLTLADAFTLVTTATLVFVVGPTLIAAFWIRYWPAHDFHVSLIVGLLLSLCIVASGYSAGKAISELRFHSLQQNFGFRLVGLTLCTMLFTMVAGLTEVKTNGEGIFSRAVNSSTTRSDFLGLSKADLVGVELVPKPSTWKSYENHFAEFRSQWCERNGLPPGVCGSGDQLDANERLRKLRSQWCEKQRTRIEACSDDFDLLEEKFISAWSLARNDHLQGLPLLDLRGRDLRNADLSYAFFPGADLRGARIDGARMDGAHAEFLRLDDTPVIRFSAVGADLRHAQLPKALLQNVDFTDANLMFADVSGDAFNQVTASDLNLQRANLVKTDFSGRLVSDARFLKTKLIHTDFSNSKFERVGVSRELLINVDFAGTTITLGDFWYAEFRNVNFRNSTFRSSLVDNAMFKSPDFYFTRFENSIVNNTRFLDLSFTRAQATSSENWTFESSISYFPNTGAPAMAKCWVKEPDDFEALIQLRTRHDSARIVDEEVRKSYHRRQALC